MRYLNGWAPVALAALRIIAALLLLEHGLMKFFAFPAAQPGLPSPMPPLMMLAGTIEIIGGALLTLGLFTRPAAFVCAGFAAAAYFMGHAGRSFYPALNNGEAAVFFCFVFFYLTFAGAGAFSLDSLMGRRQGATAYAR